MHAEHGVLFDVGRLRSGPRRREGSHTAESKSAEFTSKINVLFLPTRQTARGVSFDRDQLTAHRSLPFGTKAPITDITTDKSVVVHITTAGQMFATASSSFRSLLLAAWGLGIAALSKFALRCSSPFIRVRTRFARTIASAAPQLRPNNRKIKLFSSQHSGYPSSAEASHVAMPPDRATTLSEWETRD